MGTGGINSKYASEIKGIASVLPDISAMTTMAPILDALIGLIKPEYTTSQRGYLDQISPQAQRQLMVELTVIRAKVATWDAPA